MHVRSELTIEPFVEGKPGPHVTRAIAALTDAGFLPEIGPFGTAIEGEANAVAAAIHEATAAAFSNGATAVSTHTALIQPVAKSGAPTELIEALTPVLNKLGADLIDVEASGPDDVPLIWNGEIVAMVQPAQSGQQVAPLHEAVPRLIRQLETEFGSTLGELDREQKQKAARWLEDRGAFQLRNSVDLVADAMNVSRVTVYTYLSAVRASDS